MSRNYFVYDNDTGLIKKTLICNSDSIEYNCSETESYAIGTPEPSHKYFIDGVLIDNTMRHYETKAALQKDIRAMRESYLLTSDWTQLPDSPLSPEKKLEWAAYRLALRELPQQYAEETEIKNVIYPTQPES